MRPNIRVEIQNNLVEAMDVDENEEGEITDNDDAVMSEKHVQAPSSETPQIVKPLFASSETSVLTKKDDDKLQERARRFCLNPEEIKNFKEEDLQLLHSSLGIIPSNESKVRFEVIHMRGINQMNAGDILDYFMEYAPVAVEWIDEESCNIVWSDKISAARALHFMSKPVRGMPVRDDSSYFDNIQDTDEDDQSVLVINKNREVQLKEDDESTSNKLFNEQNSVDISEITATIPPGYWRLGKRNGKSKCLLLRFSLKIDKQPFKVEQFSRYYKSQNKRNLKEPLQTGKTQGIFGRNKDMRRPGAENPWTTLAKNWDEDAQFRERERGLETEEKKIELKTSTLRTRLGAKRKEEEPEGEAEEEEEKPVPKKKIKIPRMRMYADEEEEKIKRKQMLQKINNQIKKIDQNSSTNSDLRTVLNMTTRTHGVKLEKPEPDAFDLGSRLKNRNKKMVFQIKSDVNEDIFANRMHSDRAQKHKTHRRRHSNSDEEDSYRRSNRDHGHGKPKSKVAVVIKTQKKPSVASAVSSTVWSRVTGGPSASDESNSDNSGSEESESESEEVEVETFQPRRVLNRPGFTPRPKEYALTHTAIKNPLKIEINNDHFKK